jgi:hypothetical protein
MGLIRISFGRKIYSHMWKELNADKPVLQIFFIKVKAKESCNGPGVAQRVPGGLGSQIS